MTIKSTILSLLAPLLIGLASTETSKASQINWGNAVNFANVNFTSSRGTLDTGFPFSMGTFGSFLISAANVMDWAANWKPLDTAPYNPDFDYFTKQTSLLSNTTFASGEVAYVWIYNSKQATTGNEWFLVSDAAWEIPTATTSQTELPLQWRVNEATNLVYGGQNNIQGPGEYSSSPASFSIQTHGVVVAVPEPASFGLALISGIGLFGRRRRQCQSC